MHPIDQDLKDTIENAIIRHGKVSLLFYRMGDEWIVHKWGEHTMLESRQTDLFTKLTNGGLTEEANSLSLMPLPNDQDLIFEILTCGSLEKTLKRIGFINEGSDRS